MRLKKYISTILPAVILFTVSCHVENPYLKQEVVFNIPEQQVVNNLHEKFQFEEIAFNGISIDLVKGTLRSPANGKRIDLQVNLTNPKFKGNELAFAQELAKSVKTYVKNINEFNVITIGTENQIRHTGWSQKRTKRTLLYASSLSEFPIKNYFIANTDNN